MTTITIPAADGTGHFAAHVSMPKATPAGVVVLIQEVFGVNQALRDTADWVADMGFIAICPDLYWRVEPGVEISDKTDSEWKKAFEVFGKFDIAKGVEDLKTTIDTARSLPGANGKVATMGYCLGGRLAFMLAEQADADLNISYYGVELDKLLSAIDKITKPLILHIADRDEYFLEAARKAVVDGTRGHPRITCYNYDADHAFARVNGTPWHGLFATIANGRSAEALAKALS
jgi:carboxymethylenebutenolidase